MPRKIKEIISLLEMQKKAGRTKVASCLLDGAEDYRETLENAILRVLKRQKEVRRLNPFFIAGEMNICGFCLQEGINLPNKEWRKDYVRYRLLESGHDKALTLILQYDKDECLDNVDFNFVSIAEATIMELEQIMQRGSQMKESMTTFSVPFIRSK